MHVHAVIAHICPGMCPHVTIGENSLQTHLAGLRESVSKQPNRQLASTLFFRIFR